MNKEDLNAKKLNSASHLCVVSRSDGKTKYKFLVVKYQESSTAWSLSKLLSNTFLEALKQIIYGKL